MDVDELRCHTLQLLPIGRRCVLLLVLNHALVHRVGVCQFTVHFGPADEFLFLRLSSSMIIGECTECLTRRSNDVATATRTLMIRIYSCLV